MLIKTNNQKGFMHQIADFSFDLLRSIPNDEKYYLADLGCAYGNFISKAKELNPNINIDGYDMEQSHLDFIKSRESNINLFHANITENNSIANNKYDFVHASHILEYIFHV